MSLKRKLFATWIIILLIFAFMPVLPGSAAHAATFGMRESEWSFDEDNYSMSMWLPVQEDCTEEIDKAESSNTSVAVVTTVKTNEINVKPAGIGNCTVTVTSKGGSTATIAITVKRDYYTHMLKSETEYDFSYGDKVIKLETLPGVKGSLKVGKDKYTFTANSKGNATIKLKKVYKLKTRCEYNASWTVPGGTVTHKKSYKLDSQTWFQQADRTGSKKIKVEIYNPHKGDVIKLKYKGKTYTKKVKKDASYKSMAVTFKVKKKVSKSKATFSIKVLNKYKQTLDNKKKLEMIDGTTAEDDDDYEGDEE